MSTRRLGPLVFGAILIVAGLGWLLDRLDVLEFRIDVFLSLSLLVVGAALMYGARQGEQGGLIALGIVLSLLVVTVSLSPITTFSSGSVGEESVIVTQSGELGEGIELAIGTLEVDLRPLAVTGHVSGTISVGIGEARVQLPEGIPVDVTAKSGLGDVNVLDIHKGGVGVDVAFTSPDFQSATDRLELVIEVGIGEVEVRG